MDKTLATLASFIHGSYPESRPLSAPPLASQYDFASLLALSTPPESHRLPFHLSPMASPASCSGPSSWGGGGVVLCCVRVTLRGPCALRFFAVRWVWAFLFYHIRVWLSILYFLWLLAAVPLRWSGGLPLSVLGTTTASPVISAWLLFCYFRSLVVTCGSPGMPCLCVWLSQHSLLPYVLDDYSSVIFGALFLHTALLVGLIVTCGSPDISFLSFSFAETLLAPDDSAGGSLSAVSAPPSGVVHSIFRFLVFLCLSMALTQTYFFQLRFTASVSGVQFRTLLRHRQPCAMRVCPFCFLREPVITCGAPYFFSIRFLSLSLRCFKWFCLRFVYLERSSSIFGIRLLMQVLFSSVFRCAVSQRLHLSF